MKSTSAKNSVKNLYKKLYELSTNNSELLELADEIEQNKEPQHILSIQEKLFRLRSEDLGIDTVLCFFRNYITYIEVFEDRNLSIGLFCMGKGSSFPIHDHPHMIGITFLLTGRISYRNFDKISTDDFGVITTITTRQGDAIGPQILALTANKGNLHEIRAHENSIILDIFLPSYSEDERPCTYYKEIRENILERSNPKLLFRGLPYTGEAIK